MRPTVIRYKMPATGFNLDHWQACQDLGRAIRDHFGAKTCTHKLGYGDVPRTEFEYPTPKEAD